jgi:hypothetical protein
MFAKLKEPYQGVFNIIGLYWKVYGGWCALVFSPYFHVAIVLTLLLSHFWLHEQWWDVSLGVLPNIIGFALGGYAIWLGFGDEKFRNVISEKDVPTDHSPYLVVSASFAHFIIVQLLALCAALIAKATHFPVSEIHWLHDLLISMGLPEDFIFKNIAPISYGIGFLLFVYALLTAVAATLAVFRVAYWFDTFRNLKKPDGD